MEIAQNGWSPAIEALHTQGIRVLYVFGMDTPENQAKLVEACRNVESIEKTELYLKDLIEACALAAFTSKVWQDAQKLLNGLYQRTRKLQLHAREFGWSPLGRVLLIEKYRCLKLRDQKDVLENDPMERLLLESCTLDMTPPDPVEPDPMELILNGGW